MKYKPKKTQSFPFIEQAGMMECGTTCLAMIFKYYGFYNIQQPLAQMAEVNIEGTDLYTLIEIAESFGFTAEAYELEYKHLSEVSLPAIAHYGGNHFIVVYKATKDHVWIADPAYGKDKLSKDEFLEKWNGVSLTLEPNEKLFQNADVLDYIDDWKEKNNTVKKKYYFSILRKHSKLLFQILFLSFILQLSGLSIPLFTQAIVDHVLVNNNKNLLFSILIGMGVIFVLQIVFLYIRNILIVQLKVLLEYGFFSKFFLHFISLFQGYYDRHKREDFINRFRENLKIRQIINPNILQSFVDLIFILLYLPILWIYNIQLGFLATLLTSLFIGFAFYFSPQLKKYTNKVFFKDLEVLGKFLDVLLGMKTIKLLGLERLKFSKWQNEYKKNLNTVLLSEKVGVMLTTIQRALFYFSQIAIFWIGAYLVFNDELSLGQYLAFITIFMIILNALTNVSVIWIDLANLTVSMDRLNDILIQDSEYTEKEVSKVRVEKINSLQLRGLKFKYQKNDEQYILENLNLNIEPGQKIGVVGRNGAGKSTLVKLLVNLYPNYEGEILINGDTEIRNVNTKILRKKIFLFPQDIYLFSGTIRENIQYANPSATNDEVIEAAMKADLHDFIKSQYLGYNHVIGESGSGLSGGQALKLGFARLFISNPEVIILDEASSALDVYTEKKISENLNEHFKDKIVISIAHRLNTLKRSDQIIVLDKGMVSEKGTHDELMSANGLYYNFIKTYVDY